MMEATKKSKIKKILSIVSNVLLYTFLGVCVIVLALVVTGQNNDGATSVLGMQLRVVVSESMAPCEATDVSGFEIGSLPLNTMVFVEEKPEDPAELQQWYSELKVGDVLTFRYTYTTQVTITHRVKDIVAKDGGGYVITLTGDNRNAETHLGEQVIDTTEDENGYNYVIGKVVGSSLLLGLLVSFMKTPLALVLIVIVPCVLIIALEVVKIAAMFGKEKNEKQKRQADEIEELKRRLEEMQNRVDRADGAAEAQAPPAEQPEQMIEVTPVVVEIVEEEIVEVEETEAVEEPEAETVEEAVEAAEEPEKEITLVMEEESAPERPIEEAAEAPSEQDEMKQEDEQK